jgi:hypothetical protein
MRGWRIAARCANKPAVPTPPSKFSLLTMSQALMAVRIISCARHHHHHHHHPLLLRPPPQAQKAWDNYDVDRNGTLSLNETVALLNSEEMKKAMIAVANVEPRPKTEAEVKGLFKEADKDNSGTLSRSEFMALFLKISTERVKANPLVSRAGGCYCSSSCHPFLPHPYACLITLLEKRGDVD